MTTATVFSDNGRTYQVVNTGEEVIVSQVFIPSPPITLEKRMTHEERLERQNIGRKLLRRGMKPADVQRELGMSIEWVYDLRRRLDTTE